jgi:hypothetical protein
MKNNIKYPKEAGVYKLTCINNGKIYIGKSVNLYYRLSCHKSCEKKSNGRYYFENAIIKHGWDSFNIEILEIIQDFNKLKDNDILLEKEKYYIELFDSTNPKNGYNICKSSNDRTGVKSSEETKRNISLGQMGRKHSEETKEKIRQSKLGKRGKPHTEEHKEKMRQLNLGKKMSIESKEKLRQIRLGSKHSEEAKAKMSMFRRGNRYALGFKHSDETKEKLRAAKHKKDYLILHS